jgi:HK97 family phage major capsid protein
MSADEILKEIHDRVEALPDEFLTEERVSELVRSSFENLLEDEEFARKMRFPQTADHKLRGSKFDRWGLTAGDIEFLHDHQMAYRNYQPHKAGGPSEELQNAFEAVSEASYVSQETIREMDKRALDDAFPRIPKASLTREDRQILERGGVWQDTGAYQRAARAMDTAESGYGSQLIGAQYVGELWQAARPESRVFSLIDTFEMTDPTSYLPVEADIPEMLFVAENTSGTASDYATVKTGSNRVQVDAKKFLIHQVWSGELEEDSIIPFVPFLRRQVVLSLAHYADSAVLNGDTTNASTGNINLDDADPADTKHYLAFDGIRHAGLVDNTNNGTSVAGAITWKGLTDATKLLIDDTYLMHWGSPTSANDLIYVGDPRVSVSVGQLDEVVNWKTQAGQALLPGQEAAVLGHPYINSMAVSRTEADGKVSTTAANNTKGHIVVFNRRAFVAGWRRRVMMEMERLPGRDQTRLVHSLRLGFGRYSPTGAASGIEAAAVLYNITI